MKKSFISLIFIIVAQLLIANNVRISSVTTPDNQHIQFLLEWDNSWYTSTNYDAIWIFVKGQDCSGATTWEHLNVSTLAGNHTATGGFYVEPATDGTGVFVRRNANGFGNVSTTVTLALSTTYADYTSLNWQVFGIEMVWIPQGTFYVGDGTNNNTAGVGSAYSFGQGVSSYYTITSENAIAASAFYISKGLADCWGSDYRAAVTRNSALSASFPKGYAGFYSMKYEISQAQYVAFINDLSLVQQGNRIFASPSSPVGTYALTGGTTAQNRNSIVIKASATPTVPAIVDCDLNQDGIYGDGSDIACNFLKYEDILAYLDWAALRPMTELEYEKVCRGTSAVQPNEYGFSGTSITLTNSTNLVAGTEGTSAEVSSIEGVGLCNFGGSPGTGPLRCGFAATNTTVRSTAGATYYGVMEMTGNLWEQSIQVGWTYYSGGCSSYTYYPTTGVTFSGLNGNGTIDINGNADVANWGNSLTTILKGGGWNTPNTAAGLQQLQLSDRTKVLNTGTYPNNSRNNEIGGRGVRKL